MDWAKTTARREENHLSLVICAIYIRNCTVFWNTDKMMDVMEENLEDESENLNRNLSDMTDGHD